MREPILLFIATLLAVAPYARAEPASAVHAHVVAVTNTLSGDENPDGFVLSAAYPNPFNPRTSFSFTTETRQEITVDVFNVLGIPVERLFSGIMEANETRTFIFDAGDLPSGIYLYRVSGENFTATRQMTLLK